MTSLRLHKMLAGLLVLTLPQLFPLCQSMGCSNPVPGVRRMIRGVDITQLDLLPLDNFGGVNDGFKNPVVSFTCQENKIWRSPRGGDFQLPDQVWHMNSLPGGWLQADSKIYKTYKDVRDTMSRNVGGDIDIPLISFGFSASYSYKKMQHTIVNTSNVFADTGAYDSATQVDFIPSWKLHLDTYAKDYIDTILPTSFDSDPAAYNRFIHEFGTHYFDSANFGGYIRVVNEVKTSYFSSTTERNVTVNAKASFFKIIKANGGSVTASTNVDERFTQSTTTTTRYYGGYTNLLTDSGIQQWQPTVYSDPWLFSGKLKPISELISDSAKKASMVKAVTIHILKSYLEELDEILATINPGRSIRLRNKIDDLKSRLESLKQQEVPDENEVQVLGQDVQAALPVQRVSCGSRRCSVSTRTSSGTSRRTSASATRRGSSTRGSSVMSRRRSR